MTYQNSKKIDEIDAKSGREVKGMKAVLAISTAFAVVLMIGAFALFAL